MPPSLRRRRRPSGPASTRSGRPSASKSALAASRSGPSAASFATRSAIGEASLAEIVEPEEARVAHGHEIGVAVAVEVARQQAPHSAEGHARQHLRSHCDESIGGRRAPELAGRRTGTGERQIEVSFEVEVEHRERAAANRELAGGGRPGGETRGPGAEADGTGGARGDEVDPAVLVEVGRLQRDEPGRPAENPWLEAARGEPDLDGDGARRRRPGDESREIRPLVAVEVARQNCPRAGRRGATGRVGSGDARAGDEGHRERRAELARRRLEYEALDRDSQDAARKLTDPLLKERTRPQQVRQLLHRHPRARQVARLERRGQSRERFGRARWGVPQKLTNAQRRSRGAGAIRERHRPLAGAEQHDQVVGAQAGEAGECRVHGRVARRGAQSLTVSKEGELQVGTVGGARACDTEALEAAFEVSGGDPELGLDGHEIGAVGGETEGAQERRPRFLEPGLAQGGDRLVGVRQGVARKSAGELGKRRFRRRVLFVLELGEPLLAEAQGHFVERRRDGGNWEEKRHDRPWEGRASGAARARESGTALRRPVAAPGAIGRCDPGETIGKGWRS